MDIGAVERVGPVEQVGMRRGPADVLPALGVAGTQMEEDSRRSSDDGQKRGIDEQSEDGRQQESEQSSDQGERASVNLFA